MTEGVTENCYNCFVRCRFEDLSDFSLVIGMTVVLYNP